MYFYLGAVLTVVEAHDVAVGADHAGVLFILPVEVGHVAHGLEEVLLHVFGPAFGVADDPVEPAVFVVEVHHGVLMTAGNGDGLVLVVVPEGVVVEPVVGVLRAGAAQVQGQEGIVVPRAQHFAGFTVEQGDHVFHGIGAEVLREGQNVAVGHFEVVVVVVARHAVFLVDLAEQVQFDETGGAVGHVAEAVGTGHDVAVLHTFDVEHGVFGEQPADVAHVVVGGGQVLAGRSEEHEVVAEVVHGRIDVAAAAHVFGQRLGLNGKGLLFAGGKFHGHVGGDALVKTDDRNEMIGALGEGMHDVFTGVALAVKGHGGGGGLFALEENQRAERVDEVGIDQHMGVFKRGLFRFESGEKFLFGAVLTGDEMVVVGVHHFAAHGGKTPS